MLENEITKANLRTMIVNFYGEVLKDDLVGPFFIDKLGPNLGSKTWGEHLDILTDFWASIYLGDMNYRGSPFAPHIELEGLKAETFKRWLKLFFETVNTIYEPHIADQFKNRSTLIAGNFMRNLGL
ncbi:MAG: group III truncated hemoglobin [Sulfurimonas sp.]|nr:group III truncated hemoglobin [Sulfurimonas sp.]